MSLWRRSGHRSGSRRPRNYPRAATRSAAATVPARAPSAPLAPAGALLAEHCGHGAQVVGEGGTLALALVVVASTQDRRRVDGGRHERREVGFDRPAARVAD